MKRKAMIVAAGVAFGVVLLVVRDRLHLEWSTFWKGYFLIGALVLVGAVLFNLIYIQWYTVRMKAAVALFEQGRFDEWIGLIEGMLQKARGRAVRNVLTLNLSAGYAETKQYDRAIALLQSLADQRLYGAVKMVYYLNLCICYFYSGQTDRALALYDAGQKEFAPYVGGDAYGANLAILEVFVALARDEVQRGAAVLEQARTQWPRQRLQKDYTYLEGRLREAMALGETGTQRGNPAGPTPAGEENALGCGPDRPEAEEPPRLDP